MSPIQQIYCTHCTYGSSALEGREGELAERVLGYSARASSLERSELRNYYRQIERFLYYYLPTDTPTEEKLRLDATTAPRRMFYSPALGDIQVLGQMSYRQYDTAGRPGSYFGHVLFGPRVEPWSPLDCLKLWAAEWRDEDSADLGAALPALQNLDELLAGQRPAIDDRVLLSFLKTPLGESFDDPRQVVPERWKAVDPVQRAELLAETLQGFLNLGSQRRENLLLVVEPSVAALVFYGVVRLLPPGPVRESVSFSTFEPNADRLPVSLAATTFHAPETTDLRPEAYRRRGYVHNTFLDRHSDHGQPEGHYGRLLVGTLLAEGWNAVDQLFSGFQSAGAKTPEDLELLADIHQLVPQVLDPAAPLGETQWRQSDVAVRYLSQAVHLRLANDNAGWPQLRALIGSPNQLLVMELIASAPTAADIQGPLQFLLRKLPLDKFGELLASARLTRSAKVEALAYHLSSVGHFPEHCESLWNEGSRIGSIVAGRSEPLLPAILSRLPAPVIGPLYRTLPAEQADLFLLALLRGARPEPSLQAAQRAVAGEMLKDMDDRRFTEWLLHHRDELRHFFPPPDGVLRPRLATLLYEAPNQPEQFDVRLEALEGWVDYFSEPALAERRLVQWRKIRSILAAIRDAEHKKPANRLEALFRKPKPPDYRGLAEALQSAMPANVYPDDLRGTRKLECLEGLGRALVGRSAFLPPPVRSRMVRFFEYGDWSEYSSPRSMQRKKPARKSTFRKKKQAPGWRRLVSTKLFAFAGCAAAVVVAGLAYHWLAGGQGGDLPVATSSADSNVPSGKAAPGEKSRPADKTPTADKLSSTPVPDKGPAAGKLSPAVENPAKQGPAEAPARLKKPADEGDAGGKPQATVTPDKAAGDKSPAEPKPGADAEAPPPDDKPPRISKFADLHAVRRSALAPMKPLDLITWSEAPTQTRLLLHGLDFANQGLREQSADPKAYPQLTLEAGDAGLWTVGLQMRAPRQQEEAGKDLAKFSQTAGSLAFEWLASDRSPEISAARAWLATCVLELESDGSNEFLLLCPPVKLSEKHFLNGVAEFRSDEFKAKAAAGLPAQYFNGIDFQLAYCTVQFTDEQQLMLIEGARPADPVAADVLTSRAGVGGVRVALQRGDKNPGSWQLSLEIDAPTSLLEQRRRCDRQDDELTALRTQLAAHGKTDSTADQKQAAVRALADILNVAAPMKAVADEDDPAAQDRSRKEFDKAVEKEVLDPARRRRDELGKNLPRSNMNLKQAEAEFKRKAAEFRAHADFISAVLVRAVDDKILADCLILGAPVEPPSDEDEEIGRQ